MKIEIIQINDNSIAEVISDEIIIRETQDALDIMANCNYQGAYKIVIKEQNITPEFFDLKTGLAGDILQKFSTYRVQLAIIGEFSKFSSKSLRDFISESNRFRRINFVSSKEEAIKSLT